MSEVILTFSSLKDRLKGVEHTVHKHSSFITDLGRSSGPSQPGPPVALTCVQPPTGNTKDKIISELDKIQQEVREHVETRPEDLDGLDRNVRRLENLLLLEMGEWKKSADGLDKRLSKLEDVSGRLDGVFHSSKEGSVEWDQRVPSAGLA